VVQGIKHPRISTHDTSTLRVFKDDITIEQAHFTGYQEMAC